MSQTVRYGAGASFQVDAAGQSSFFSSRGTALSDPAAAVAASLADPLDFPPIDAAIVPDDCIVLALARSVPQATAIVAGVVHTLLLGETRPSDITILQADADNSTQPDPRALLPGDVRESIELETHDPTSQDHLAYLAATRDGTPVYLNRTLCDADVVVPIGCGRLGDDAVYLPDSLFPEFSSNESRQAQQHNGLTRPPEALSRRDLADEVAWLLGVQFAVQVIPGPGNSVLHVLAGDAASVTRRGQQLCQAAWQFEVPQRANLVLATIEGGPEQQTWDNFARALQTASRAVEDDGAIVVCTELQSRPGRALARFAHAAKPNGRSAEPEDEWDNAALSVLGERFDRVRVFLLSNLDEEVVEPLGMGHVSHPDEINRLTRQHNSCIFLSNAHRAFIKVRDG